MLTLMLLCWFTAGLLHAGVYIAMCLLYGRVPKTFTTTVLICTTPVFLFIFLLKFFRNLSIKTKP